MTARIYSWYLPNNTSVFMERLNNYLSCVKAASCAIWEIPTETLLVLNENVSNCSLTPRQMKQPKKKKKQTNSFFQNSWNTELLKIRTANALHFTREGKCLTEMETKTLKINQNTTETAEQETSLMQFRWDQVYWTFSQPDLFQDWQVLQNIFFFIIVTTKRESPPLIHFPFMFH